MVGIFGPFLVHFGFRMRPRMSRKIEASLLPFSGSFLLPIFICKFKLC